MEVVEVKGFEIQGLVLRTRNEIEMNPETANIPKHVEYVDSNLVINYQSGARAYSVYYNYESDVDGYFDVLMGANEYPLQMLRCHRYLFFLALTLSLNLKVSFLLLLSLRGSQFGRTLLLLIVRMKGLIQQILSTTKVRVKLASTLR